MERMRMFNFQEKAQKIVEILEALKKEDHITAEKLPEILGEVFDGMNNINLYPGYPDDKCYHLALFISLQESVFQKRGRGRIKHLPCSKVMEKIVQHMLGHCNNITKEALFITDNWDIHAYEKWKGNLTNIKKDAYFEVYLKIENHAIQIM